jgi:predicted transcriptional regulator
MSRKKVVCLNFEDIFLRVTKKTTLSNIVQLADFLGISQSAVSQKKKEKNFPLEWVYKISKQFNLSLDWLTEGKEVNGDGGKLRQKRANALLDEIEEWLIKEGEREPKIFDWFEVEFKEKFTKYAEWKRRADNERENSLVQRKKIA